MFKGKIYKGQNKAGRFFGYPTLNIMFEKTTFPNLGIYSCICNIEEWGWMQSILLMAIDTAPINHGELHILNFSSSACFNGKQICVNELESIEHMVWKGLRLGMEEIRKTSISRCV